MASVVENPKAITSWSGFVYQGKIALLATLNELVENYSYYKECSLKIEKIDDFSFHDSGGLCISAHQVKCKKANTQGSYNEAILSLKTKKSALNNISVYLHVSIEIPEYSDADVELYEINEKSYISISEIDNIALNILERLVESNFNEISFKKRDLLAIWNSMNKSVTDLVLEAHRQNMEEGRGLDVVNREILISEFTDIIENYDISIPLGVNSVIDLVKQHFALLIRDYIVEEDVEGDEQGHLYDLCESLMKLESNEFIDFLNILNPIEINTNKFTELEFISSIPTGFDVPFLYFIGKTYSLGSFVQKKRRYEVENEGKLFIPYGHKDSSVRKLLAFTQKLAISMFENKNTANLFYTGDCIVTNEVNLDNVFEYMRKNNCGISPYIYEGENYNEPKKIKLIDFKAALSVLGVSNE